jgi:hypothetical protein
LIGNKILIFHHAPFNFLTCVQKFKSIFQVKVAKFLIRPEIGGSTLVRIASNA